MSTCLEYLRLHQGYVGALRSWTEATVLGSESVVASTEVERRDAFGRLSHHKVNCRECQGPLVGEEVPVFKR